MSDYEKLFKMKQDDWLNACDEIDRLEAMCEKLGAAAVKLGLVKDLYNPDYIPSVRDLIDAEDEFIKVLAEYRAMKEKKNE